jgi:protein phosphatase
LNRTEAEQAKQKGVTAVLDLTSEFSETTAFRRLAYQNIPILDLTGLNPAQLRQAVEFIERHEEDGVVYIHCKAGYSRTAAVAGAYLIASGRAATTEEAMALLRKARPSIVIRPEARVALESMVQDAGRRASIRQMPHAL